MYYNIESALALVVTLFINVCVISVFARGFFGKETEEAIGLANAGAYLGETFGKHMTLIWAVGLLAAGQSSTMTGTYAGQFVMGGFLDLKISPGLRTLVTRAVAICPTLLVALSHKNDSTKLDALNQGINILQSVQLPFAVIPLLLLTSDKAVMGRFVNSKATSATCWAIAAAIIGINASTAFETLAPFMTAGRAWWIHTLFWSSVALYVGFLLYLVITPEGAQQLAATVSRQVSHMSLRRRRGTGAGGSSASESSLGSLEGTGPGGANGGANGSGSGPPGVAPPAEGRSLLAPRTVTFEAAAAGGGQGEAVGKDKAAVAAGAVDEHADS